MLEVYFDGAERDVQFAGDLSLEAPAELGISRRVIAEVAEKRAAVAAEEIGPDDSLRAVGEGVGQLGTNHVLAAGEGQRAGNLRF